jgi:hypothetical protein
MGYYTITDISSGTTVTVTAAGYLETSRTFVVERAADFQLMPVPKTTTTTMADMLDSGVGKCHDGAAMKPCHIMAIAIHNQGPLDAALTWESEPSADLDLSLFESGSTTPIARSASPGDKDENISVNLTAGATYDLRVTYAGGTSPAKYTLRVTHQN